MPPNHEVDSGERLRDTIGNIATSVAGFLTNEHGMEPTSISDVKKAIVTGYSQQEMSNKFRAIGYPIEGSLGPASVLPIPNDHGETDLTQIVWFDLSHPYLKDLADFNKYNFEQHQQGMLMVAEETSHFLYKEQYFKRFGELPSEWLAEMIGAMDKFAYLQNMYVNRYQRGMNPQEMRVAESMIFTALDARPGSAPVEHAIGHTQAFHLVRHLNNLAATGRVNEATQIEHQFYTAHEQRVKTMLSPTNLNRR